MLSRTDDLALLMGRVFVAALFLPHGFHKLMTFWSFAASLGAKGVPYSNAIAVLAVVAEILGPLTLILGLWPRGTALVLAVLTILELWLALFATHRAIRHGGYEPQEEHRRRLDGLCRALREGLASSSADHNLRS